MKKEDIEALRASHCPQPLKGRVAHGIHVALVKGVFYLYDDRQTVGYLCGTEKLSLLHELLAMEEQSPGSIRTLITGEPSPWDTSPPEPWQDTYTGSAKVDIRDLLNRRIKDV